MYVAECGQAENAAECDLAEQVPECSKTVQAAYCGVTDSGRDQYKVNCCKDKQSVCSDNDQYDQHDQLAPPQVRLDQDHEGVKDLQAAVPRRLQDCQEDDWQQHHWLTNHEPEDQPARPTWPLTRVTNIIPE